MAYLRSKRRSSSRVSSSRARRSCAGRAEVGAAALWGSASGLAFGMTVWRAERRRHFGQLSTRRIMLWGAVAGAAFPVLLYTPLVLRGALNAIPFFSMLVGLSAVAGVACARATLAIAKRAPDRAEDLAAVTASPLALDPIPLEGATQAPLVRDATR
jgi:hypothetical protein